MVKNKQKGFTIIELIVVISILALMFTIVIFNVTSSLSKGKDTAIKGNLSTLLSRGVKYFESTGGYNDFCTDINGGGPVKDAIEAQKIGSIFTCNCDGDVDCFLDENTKWCACAPLKFEAGNTFCVDSSGYKRQTTADCSTRCISGECQD